MHRLISTKLVQYSLNLLLIALFFSFASHAGTTLNFPRLSWETGTFTGIAIANPNNATATVTLTAYGEDGKLLAGPGITNPITIEIGANQQLAQTTYELFGSGLASSTVGWFQATSETDNLTGFFLFLNGKVTFFDGADLPESATKIVFNEMRLKDEFSTELNIINTNNWDASLTLNLLGGPNPVSKTLTIPAMGASRLDVSTFFEVTNYPEPAYVTVVSDVDIAGFAFVRGEGDLLGSNGRPVSEKLNTLFFPQVAILDPYKSELAVLNYGQTPAILTITVYQGNGQLFGSADLQQNPVTRALSAGEILREDLEKMFGFEGTELLDGWLKVESSSALINGSLTYALPGLKSLAAVSTEAQGRRRALFSHIATTQGYFTGIAILNGGSLAANLRVVALEPDGKRIGTFTSTLQPGERMSKLITDLIPAAANRNGGMIWVSSDLPVYMTGLFVNIKNGVLANIAPQPVADSFRPDQGEPDVTLSPGLAILPPAQAQAFTLKGATGPVQWSVNGVPGGTAATGKITDAGRYSAPANVPTGLPVTVTAQSGNQRVGASVDILSQQALVGGLGLLQSVAYLGGLQKLYVAELRLTTSGSPSQKSPQGTDTAILDVTGAPQTVLNIAGEEVSKMIPYTGRDGKEYLLLASKNSGRIIRLNPTNKQTQTVAGGLQSPAAIVLDPVSGDLLVAEANQVTTVPRSQLDQGLTGSAELLETRVGGRLPSQIRFNASAFGIVVDPCTGNIYLSDPEQGAILVYDRATGQISVFTNGQVDPGQMTAMNRSGLSCPASSHILLVEKGRGRLNLLIPDGEQVLPWLDAPEIQDVAFLPEGNSILPGAGVALAGAVEGSGMIDVAAIPGLYQQEPVNPPFLSGPGFQGPCSITQVTDMPYGYSWAPDISANGNYITFMSSSDFTEENPGGEDQVFLYNRMSSSFQQVTQMSPSQNLGAYPELDGDGSHLVFDSHVDLTGGGPGIHIYETGTRNLRLLVGLDDEGFWDASIDDSGTFVVFTSTSDLTELNPDNRSQVFATFTDFEELFQYSQNNSGDYKRAEFSGDGNSVGALFFDNLFMDVHLNFSFVATMQDDQPPDSPFSYALYQPRPNYNGTRLAFNSRENLTGQNPDRGREAFLFDSGSGSITQLTASPDRDSGQVAINGGGNIVVVVSKADLTGDNPEGNTQIFVADCQPVTEEF